MRILFIASNRIGDAVLSTGVLGGLMERYPQAEFWDACGPLAVPVFAHAPRVTGIIEMRKEKRIGHWRKLLKATMFRRFDIVVDLRGSATAWLLWTFNRRILKPEHTLHRVEHNARTVGLDPAPSPRLWPGEEMIARAKKTIPDGMNVLAMGPTAAWPGKMWPVERFAELARRLLAPISEAFVQLWMGEVQLGVERNGREGDQALPQTTVAHAGLSPFGAAAQSRVPPATIRAASHETNPTQGL